MQTELQKIDPELFGLIEKEEARTSEGLELIASENYPSKAVREALGSILSAKYAEGYPGRRYYGGNEYIDQIENLAIDRAKEVFGAEHANVQPYSGSPANLAVYLGMLELGDTLLGLQLTHGGHLTHGHRVSFSGRGFNAVHYGVDPKTGLIDYNQIKRIAQETKPKLIVSGATAYPRKIDFKAMGEIARSVGALHMADISHIAGLVAAGQHESPVPYADIVTTTTHKTLRGPRAAIIMSRKKFATQIDKAVFPGIQGGPHMNAIAGIAVALKEAQSAEFKRYINNVVDNAVQLAMHLAEDSGYKIASDGTDNHLLLVDLSDKRVTGSGAEEALTMAGMTVNKNTVPGETRSPMDPSGIRIGTPAITTRGATKKDMQKIASWINAAIISRDDKKKLSNIQSEVSEYSSTLIDPTEI